MTDQSAGASGSVSGAPRKRKRQSTVDLEGSAISACSRALAPLKEDKEALARVLDYLKTRFAQ